jgi:hypothetical protein
MGARRGMPGKAATSIVRCRRAPVKIAANPFTPAVIILPGTTIAAAASTMTIPYATKDKMNTPAMLCVIPPWVNRYREGFRLEIGGKKMSVSGITVPKIANGMRGVSPEAENTIEAIRAWESASTRKGCSLQGKKAYRSDHGFERVDDVLLCTGDFHFAPSGLERNLWNGLTQQNAFWVFRYPGRCISQLQLTKYRQ